MAKKKTVTKEATKPGLTMCITVPSEGISVKVTGANGYMLGTLNINQDGVKFIKTKAKKVPERVLTWEILDKLGDIGLV